ncbi:MAG: M1 family metallopeptidase [bacterium]|nr:M1 family metallopeptidase [bacterium]
MAVAFLFIVIPGFTGCSPSRGNGNEGLNSQPPSTIAENNDQLFNETFRIDITNIRVIFDYVPASYYVDFHAVVTFRMRPGQRRPVIHMDPVTFGEPVEMIRLNGEELNVSDRSDVRIVRFDGTVQDSLEFQRDLEEGRDHTLEMSYRLTLGSTNSGNYVFSTSVNDIRGRGNEALFPTINTPHELARHHLTFRVHGDTPFRCIGSGLVEKEDPGVENVQQWTLDTEREVASYTVMFILLPVADSVFEERNIAGVDVRVMSYDDVSSNGIEGAFSRLESWLPQLITDLGPFPMPRGISIFLTGGGGGMEYFGGTLTSLNALKHEVFHMYYGCSTVNKTYRDTWMDEAITMWYTGASDDFYEPIPESYRSGIVGDRSPINIGFDTRAYNEGAQIIQAVSQELGGRTEMIAFLRHLHLNYSFAPFNTFEFLDVLKTYSGIAMKDRFLNWLYDRNQAGQARSKGASARHPMHHVDLTAPPSILKKYRRQ